MIRSGVWEHCVVRAVVECVVVSLLAIPSSLVNGLGRNAWGNPTLAKSSILTPG